MRPLRRKTQIEVTDDLLTGTEKFLDQTDEIDVLADDGAINSIGKHKKYFNSCGCGAPPAGRCAQCGQISCANCHGRCEACAVPICLECSRYLDSSQGKLTRLCRQCRDELVRRNRIRAVVRFLLSPFVDIEK